jgi:hypothetical protein
MLYKDLLEEYFSINPMKGKWQYTFTKKPCSDWKVLDSSRIARTSAGTESSLFLFTIGAKQVCQPFGLNETLIRIIESCGLMVEEGKTTAGNRDATYVGFDLASKECSRDTLRRVLNEAKLAIAECSRKTGRLL